MNESEWLTATDPTPMLEFVKEHNVLRKWRLLGAALCRAPLPWQHLGNRLLTAEAWETIRPTIEVVEALADDPTFIPPSGLPEVDFHHAFDVSEMLHGGTAKEKLIEVKLIRDIFGNPFRPITVELSWLTSDVTALADGIYQERAFDRLPILADALLDAGCENEDVLNHCRDANHAHVRGCWVLDLLLGKG